ncbi:MAG TPA: GNAT family N-acetyltransferase [Solirubrobacterales bacterium]|nr:GNAT family N-acetyltransferase [Solirubrobacterales bacterium]
MSETSARAELIDDRGAAAVSDQFFRSRPFLDAEEETSEGTLATLRIEHQKGTLVAPILVRQIDGGPERDAISPYGYPGLVESEGDPGDVRRSLPAVAPPDVTRISPALDLREIDFSETGLVSLFLRHTLADPPLTATTARNVVQIADPALPAKSRMSDRQQIRKNLKRGYELEIVPGAETTPAQRAGFLLAYEQTMVRTGAAQRYFFGAAYFDRLLEAERTWLALATAPDGAVAAASVAAASDGFLHYYLSGSADSHLRDSPMKNVLATLCEFAAELSLPLNLGGGIAAGDRLEEFKRGFANREEVWRTSEIVCDREVYEWLAADRDAAGFFPAYRAS